MVYIPHRLRYSSTLHGTVVLVPSTITGSPIPVRAGETVTRPFSDEFFVSLLPEGASAKDGFPFIFDTGPLLGATLTLVRKFPTAGKNCGITPDNGQIVMNSGGGHAKSEGKQ